MWQIWKWLAMSFYMVIICSKKRNWKQRWVCNWTLCPATWDSSPFYTTLLSVQLSRPPKAWVSWEGHLVCSWPPHPGAHLLKSVTFHTLVSAGGLPHAAPTIWIEFILNHQSHHSTSNKTVAVLKKNEEELSREGNVSPYVIWLGKCGHRHDSASNHR